LLNPHVDGALRSARVWLPVQRAPVGAAEAWVSGVSSFGYAGTIAHTVLRMSHALGMVEPSASGTTVQYRRRAFLWRDSKHPFARQHFSFVGATHTHTTRQYGGEALTVDADSPLMEAGISSSQAVQLATLLRTHVSTADIAATLVFNHPTPRLIATHLAEVASSQPSELRSADAIATLVQARILGVGTLPEAVLTTLDTRHGVAVDAALPTSTFQQHFVLLHLLQPHAATYSLPVVLDLQGVHMSGIVRHALQQLVSRHSVLRTFYGTTTDHFTQIVLPEHGFSVPLSECEETQWFLCAKEALFTPFTLTQAPPMRALLMSSVALQRTRLLLVIHHAAIDYRSTLLVERELVLMLEAAKHQQPPLLPALPLQYADFAIRQRLGSSSDNTLLEWWRATLHGAPPLLLLPLDRPRRDAHSAVGASTAVQVAPTPGKVLSELCKVERVSSLTGIIASWSALMLYLSRQDAVVIGQPYSVQSQDPALENLVGCFATPIPVHIRAHPGTTTFRQLLQHAYAELLDAIDHADIPLFRVAQAVVKARSATHNLLFQTIVQLLPTAILPQLRQTMADDPNDLIPSEADQLLSSTKSGKP